MRSGDRGKSRVKIAAASHLPNLKLHAQRSRGSLRFPQVGARLAGIAEDRDPRDGWGGLPDKLQALAGHLGLHGHARDVAARPREVGNEPATGSLTNPMTMGIVLVALCAACAPVVVAATMMSTLSFTSSAARSEYRSSFP